jgi:hypothetical protein
MNTETKTKQKVLLLHRRGRDTNLRTEFDSQKEALEFAKEHKLMIVHTETDRHGDLKLFYLPD